MGFRKVKIGTWYTGIAVEIHDHYSDGWDFCDAVREETLTGESLARTAEAYFKEWGTLQHGYTMKDFRELDCSEGRK
jgi:hypothetical protein